MTWMTIFGLMTMAGLFVCMIPLLCMGFKSLNLNDKMLEIIVDDKLEMEKRIYEKFWDELDGLLIQTKQVERLKEQYQKKIAELEDTQKLNSTIYKDVHIKNVRKNYNTF